MSKRFVAKDGLEISTMLIPEHEQLIKDLAQKHNNKKAFDTLQSLVPRDTAAVIDVLLKHASSVKAASAFILGEGVATFEDELAYTSYVCDLIHGAMCKPRNCRATEKKRFAIVALLALLALDAMCVRDVEEV